MHHGLNAVRRSLPYVSSETNVAEQKMLRVALWHLILKAVLVIRGILAEIVHSVNGG